MTNHTDELDLLVTDDDYAETVTIGVDITVPAAALPSVVNYLKDAPGLADCQVDFPDYSPLAWEHTLPAFRAIFDEGN